MRIRFVQSFKVQQTDGNGPEYLAGQAYDFNGFVAETYARKYIRRGYAVEEPAEAAPPAMAAVAPEVVEPPLTPPAAPRGRRKRF